MHNPRYVVVIQGYFPDDTDRDALLPESREHRVQYLEDLHLHLLDERRIVALASAI